MNQLTRYLDNLDQRRHRPEPAVNVCACCEEPGRFDVLHVDYPSEHHEQMAARFGGECCVSCLDAYAPCEWCGQLTDERSADHYCPDCEDWITEGADRPAWK